MRNWQRDGWTEKDWDAITQEAHGLRAIARDFDDAVGGGGGGFEPKELAGFAERLHAMADRLKRCSAAYL